TTGGVAPSESGSSRGTRGDRHPARSAPSPGSVASGTMVRPGALYAKVRDPHPVAVDVLLAAVLAALGVATELVKLPETEAYRDGTAVSVLLALAATVPLVWRRSHPAAVMAVTAA